MNVSLTLARKRRQLPTVGAAALLAVVVALLAAVAVAVGDGWPIVRLLGLAGAALVVALLIPLTAVRLGVVLARATDRRSG